jgi:uncharacterized protein (TIGR00369 family)
MGGTDVRCRVHRRAERPRDAVAGSGEDWSVNWQQMLDGTVSGSFQHPALDRLALPNFSGWEPGRVWGEWDLDPELCNPDGALFGGYLAALADATAGHAVATTLDDNEGFATADLHISYHRPVRGGRLRFEGVVVHRGRQVAHVEVRFTGQDGGPLATAHATEVVTRGARRRGLGGSR